MRVLSGCKQKMVFAKVLLTISLVATVMKDGALGAQGPAQVFRCEYDFTSERTGERFQGSFGLQTNGDITLTSKRGIEVENKCVLFLKSLDDGEQTVSGTLKIVGSRLRACEPLLSNEMRKRLDDLVEVGVGLRELGKKIGPRQADLAVIYLEGFRPCQVSVWYPAKLNKLVRDIKNGKIKVRRDVQPAEPLDVSDEIKKLKSLKSEKSRS